MLATQTPCRWSGTLAAGTSIKPKSKLDRPALASRTTPGGVVRLAGSSRACSAQSTESTESTGTGGGSSAAAPRVLILGGSGRIGSSVAADVIRNTDANVIITGRDPAAGKRAREALGQLKNTPGRVEFLPLDLGDHGAVEPALRQLKRDSELDATQNCGSLVVHCAGPFHHRNDRVLRSCIDLGINYTDVSDAKAYTVEALKLSEAAEKVGVTAVINTGVFPGISNSMVLQGVERLDTAKKVQLNYVVAGSGGAGLTVMRTTFLGLLHPLQAWLGGKWVSVQPYSEREAVDLPAPYGRAYVYWFEMPETYTLAQSFDVDSVVTKFGSVPDLYNHLTWMTAHIFPKPVMRMDFTIEALSRVSKAMTDVTDSFSGVWVAMQCDVQGTKGGKPCHVQSTVVHPNTAVVCGAGTGSVAQLILEGKLNKPGVNPVERALTTELFEETMKQRGIKFQHKFFDT